MINMFAVYYNHLGDAHDFYKEDSAFTRSKNRRRKRHKEKIYDVSDNLRRETDVCFVTKKGLINVIPGVYNRG